MKHEVTIQSNPSLSYGTVSHVRKTNGKKSYVACVVATVTERTIELGTAALNEARVKLAPITADVVAAGFDPNTFSQESNARDKAHWEAFYAARDLEAPAIDDGKFSPRYSEEQVNKAHAAADAIAPKFSQELRDLAHQLSWASSAVSACSRVENLKVGDQMVVAWSSSVALAEKAMAGTNLREKGYTLEIRTDIVVTPK